MNAIAHNDTTPERHATASTVDGTPAPNAIKSQFQLEEQGSATTYRFRTECIADAHLVHAALKPWARDWTEQTGFMEDVEGLYGDAEVTFTVSAGAPTASELRWLIDCLTDCHVAAQSLCVAGDYDGDRDMERAWLDASCRPDSDAVAVAQEALARHQTVLKVQIDRTAESQRTLKAAATGALPRGDGLNPGWLLAIGHPDLNLTAIRRVAAPMFEKRWHAHSSRRIKARMALLNG